MTGVQTCALPICGSKKNKLTHTAGIYASPILYDDAIKKSMPQGKIFFVKFFETPLTKAVFCDMAKFR